MNKDKPAMSVVIFRNKVQDFASWKTVFDATEPARKAAGELSAQVVQVEGDPNDVIIIFTYSSADAAKALISSPEIQEAMQKAGVQGTPDVVFGTAA